MKKVELSGVSSSPEPLTEPARSRSQAGSYASGRAACILVAIVWMLSVSSHANAFEASSASYVSRGGATNAGSVALLSTAATPAFSSAAGSIGQSEAVGLGGSATSLRTSRAGFWAIEQQGLATLDFDADGIQSFLDDDDDNDGLDDVVETNSGIFNSEFDTGSDPLNPDTDGDGVDDGTEVAMGTNPNVDESTLPQVPALSLMGQLSGVICLAFAGVWLLAERKRAQPKTQSIEREFQ